MVNLDNCNFRRKLLWKLDHGLVEVIACTEAVIALLVANYHLEALRPLRSRDARPIQHSESILCVPPQ